MKILNLLICSTLLITNSIVLAQSENPRPAPLSNNSSKKKPQKKAVIAKNTPKLPPSETTTNQSVDDDGIQNQDFGTSSNIDFTLMKQSKSVLANDPLTGQRYMAASRPTPDGVMHALRQDKTQVSAMLYSQNTAQADSPQSQNTTELQSDFVGVSSTGVRSFGSLHLPNLKSPGKAIGFAGGVGVGLNDLFGLGLSLHQGDMSTSSQLMLGVTAAVMLGSTDLSLMLSKDYVQVDAAQRVADDLVMSAGVQRQVKDSTMTEVLSNLNLRYSLSPQIKSGLRYEHGTLKMTYDSLFIADSVLTRDTIVLTTDFDISKSQTIGLAPYFCQANLQTENSRTVQYVLGTQVTYLQRL